MALTDTGLTPNPHSTHIRLVDELEVLAVDAFQVAQVLNLNFGGNLLKKRPSEASIPRVPVLGLSLAEPAGRPVYHAPMARSP